MIRGTSDWVVVSSSESRKTNTIEMHGGPLPRPQRTPNARYARGMRLSVLVVALVSMITFLSCAKNEATSGAPPKEAPTTSSPATTQTATVTRAAPTPSAAASATSGDEAAIDRLVARLAASPLWVNGLSPTLDVPATAKPDEVLNQMFTRISFDRGRVTKHTILATKIVRIPPESDPYTAFALDTNLGPKLVLMKHQGNAGFWTRVFDRDP